MRNRRNYGGIFLFGGICYGLIEIVWRGKTHWSMPLTGGACFMTLVRVFEKIAEFPMIVKCLTGGMIITVFEFFSGCIFNKLLKLKVWDYSRYKFNFKGQICPLYSFLWVLLSCPISIICKKIDE